MLATTFGVPIAEFVIWPSLVDPDSIEQTVRNIRADEGAFLVASFAYLSAFVGDLLVAWALYYLLRPVHRPRPWFAGCESLSLPAAPCRCRLGVEIVVFS